MSRVERCATCGTSLGTLVQETMLGVPMRCIDCTTTARIKMMLSACPDEDDAAFGFLSAWEQKFLVSVRQQFDAKGAVSEKQYQAIERIYQKA